MPSHAEAHSQFKLLKDKLSSSIKGQDRKIDYILACYFTQQHLLLEDYPGTGKTTLAKTLARLINDSSFKRVQFTPDLLPSDLTGISIFNPSEQNFTFHEGPLFSDIVLADEINRASPRTQSALLEAMAERQITVEGVSHSLPEQFFVIATQNPADFRGTYPLPEAQMDRFALQCSLGYLTTEEELALLSSKLSAHQHDENFAPLNIHREDIRNAINAVHLADEVKDYLVSLISASRGHQELSLPLSPRATIALAKLAQALSFFDQKDYVSIATIKELAPLVLSHRITLKNAKANQHHEKVQFIKRLIESCTTPK